MYIMLHAYHLTTSLEIINNMKNMSIDHQKQKIMTYTYTITLLSI